MEAAPHELARWIRRERRARKTTSCRRSRTLFAGKLHAILARRWVKSRDWFDLVWYLTERKGLEPNLELLEHALAQTKTSALPREGWRAAVTRRLETLDWKAVVADLRPFVERQSDLEVLSKEAIHKLLDDG